VVLAKIDVNVVLNSKIMIPDKRHHPRLRDIGAIGREPWLVKDKKAG